MSKSFFDRAYRSNTQQAVEELYDDWAGTYDRDLTDSGYVTPRRCALALAGFLQDYQAPIFDFACGTGMSGAALADQGFAAIDGVDLSDAMLDKARARGIYRHLRKVEPDAALHLRPGDYAAIAAVGAISPGAAPAFYVDELLSGLAPGGLLVLSYNDLTLPVPGFLSRIERAIDNGRVRERFREHGDHILELGSKSTVYVLERLERKN